jgi:Holliday junction resolvase RusA-like endonuclease
MLLFEIPGNPIPKQRHRTFTRNGNSFSYDPQDKEKKAVKAYLADKVEMIMQTGTDAEILAAHDIAKADGLYVGFVFCLPVAQSLSKKKQAEFYWNSFHQTKPDIDNLAKFYLDCANEILWSDDKKIISLNVKKKYSDMPKTIMYVKGIVKKEIDDKTWQIISGFSPSDIDIITSTFSNLSNALEYIEMDIEDNCQIRAKDAARIVSRLADKYGKQLHEIAKKYPNYWKE